MERSFAMRNGSPLPVKTDFTPPVNNSLALSLSLTLSRRPVELPAKADCEAMYGSDSPPCMWPGRGQGGDRGWWVEEWVRMVGYEGGLGGWIRKVVG